MKKRYRFLLLIVLLALFFIVTLWFQARRLLLSPKLQEALAQKVQVLTEGTLRYQGFRVRYFPQPQIILEHPQLTFTNDPLVVEADAIGFDFSILPLFFGRADPVAFYAQNGRTHLSLPFLSFMNPVPLEHFSLQIGAIRPRIPIPIHFVSDFAGKPKVLVFKGHVIVDSVEKWNWEKTSGHFVAELKELSIGRSTAEPKYDPKSSFLFKSGQVNTFLEIQKKSGEAFLEIKTTGSGKALTYEVLQEKEWVTPPSFDAEWDFTTIWDHSTEELKFQKMIVKMPFGNLEANGGFKLSTGEISGMHLTVSKMILENLLQYWPGLEKILPFHIGFSGPSKWVLALEGTLDHLSLHLNCALSDALLTYRSYFAKPKDVPLDLTVDFLIQKGKTLSGDFAVKFQQMSMKGNLTGLDLTTGEGQLNLITNKFSVTGWEQYIPLLQDYKLKGEVKILSNWKGDLRKLEQAEHILNVTIEQGACVTAEGKGISNAVLYFDYSPLMFEGRKMQFDLGGSKFMADLKMTDDSGKVNAAGKLSSEELKPLGAWQSFMSLFQHKPKDVGPDIYDHVKRSLEILFPAEQSLKNFSSEIRYVDKKVDIASLKFEGYGGQADFKGTIRFQEQEPRYHGEGKIRGLNFGLFLGRQDSALKFLEGTLFFKSSFDGAGWGKEAWAQSLKGQGEIKLENGKFQSFDLKDAMATIGSLKTIKDVVPALRDFESMDFNWQVFDGKISTENLLVKSKDYVVSGKGTIGFDGLSNFRVDSFLSLPLAAKVLPDMAPSLLKETRAHLGPIPLLISGQLTSPEVKPDPAQAEGLTQRIQHGRAKDVLYELVIE